MPQTQAGASVNAEPRCEDDATLIAIALSYRSAGEHTTSESVVDPHKPAYRLEIGETGHHLLTDSPE